LIVERVVVLVLGVGQNKGSKTLFTDCGWKFCGWRARSLCIKGMKGLGDEGLQVFEGKGTLAWRRDQQLCWKTWDEGLKVFQWRCLAWQRVQTLLKRFGMKVPRRAQRLLDAEGFKTLEKTWDKGFKVIGMKGSKSLGWRAPRLLYEDGFINFVPKLWMNGFWDEGFIVLGWSDFGRRV